MDGNYWIWVVGLLVVYGVVLYFLSIRPQKKQEKKMQAMLDALEVGDSIETSGGLFGVVIDVSGDIIYRPSKGQTKNLAVGRPVFL